VTFVENTTSWWRTNQTNMTVTCKYSNNTGPGSTETLTKSNLILHLKIHYSETNHTELSLRFLKDNHYLKSYHIFTCDAI
jgi:hypothetical protein